MKIIDNYCLPLISLIVIIVVFAFFLNNAFALSPSFQRQKIVDRSHWKLIVPSTYLTIIQTPVGNRVLNLSNNSAECLLSHQYLNSSYIDGVTYFSDGRTLNATLWLSDMFKELPLINNDTMLRSFFGEIPYLRIYGMSLAIHTPYSTPETDYTFSLRRNAISKIWNISLIEHSPSGETRTAYNSTIKSNIYRSFFGNGTTGFVNLSLDLAKFNYPNDYDLFFLCGGLLYKKWSAMSPNGFNTKGFCSTTRVRRIDKS
jgi:hypothetical protein